jgi:hypothetical protein
MTPNLEGRFANCGYPGHGKMPSSTDLAFFDYRGPGSAWATLHCKCGYHLVAHKHNPDRVSPDPIKCRFGGFVERGPAEFDSYYCGCRGWD